MSVALKSIASSAARTITPRGLDGHGLAVGLQREDEVAGDGQRGAAFLPCREDRHGEGREVDGAGVPGAVGRYAQIGRRGLWVQVAHHGRAPLGHGNPGTEKQGHDGPAAQL